MEKDMYLFNISFSITTYPYVVVLRQANYIIFNKYAIPRYGIYHK